MESHGDGRPPKTVEPATWQDVEKSLAYKLPADLPVYPDFLLAWSTVPGKTNISRQQHRDIVQDR